MNNIITNLELKILALFAKEFTLKKTIRQISKDVKGYYANVHKAIKELEKKQIITTETIGKAKICSLNTKTTILPAYLTLAEESKAQQFIHKFPFLRRVIEEAKKITPVSCIGLFGSQAENRATTASDIDMFMLIEENKIKSFKNFIQKNFPELEQKIDLNIVSFTEFIESIKSSQLTVSKEIVKNKIILSGAEIFYQILQEATK